MDFTKTPDFIIIGAQKSGTSTLFHYLNKHPEIFMPWRKELHFFDENYSKGLDWYLHFFNKKKAICCSCAGEASPYYFFHPLVASRIYDAFPEIKLILLLRNPVNRSYSQYHHMKRKGRISLSFEHCIHLEQEIMKGRKDAFFKNSMHSDLMFRRFSFLARSRYAEQLMEWYKLFGREQILIIKSEDYFRDSQAICQQIFQFLGLPAFTIPLKSTHKSSEYPPMKPETRQQLQSYFEPFNQELNQLVGRDFGWQ